mgnify:CR=1 FL=1
MKHVIKVAKAIPWVPLCRAGYKIVWLLAALFVVILAFSWKAMIFLLSLIGDENEEAYSSADKVCSEIKTEIAKEVAGLAIEFLG